MGSRELRIGAMLALIFITGVLTGVFLGRSQVARSPEPARTRPSGGPPVGRDDLVMAEMREKLKLTPEQEQRIAPILSEWSRKVKQNHQQSLKERFEIFERTMPLLRTNLTPDQLKAHDDLIERVRRRHRQMLNRAN